jgi:glutamyl-tRNA reductase
MMAGRLVVVGLSHKTAPVEVRERCAFPDEALKPALEEAVHVPGVGEAMIVSTCNRVELYAAAEASEAAESLRRFFVNYDAGGTRRLGDGRDVAPLLYAHEAQDAVRHLFRVASSLDSMVVGESQILGQVKQAYQIAIAAGTIGPVLGRTLPRAFSLAKRVRTETEVARASSSVASVAVDLARHIFGDLRDRQVLVLGAGKMGELAARHLIGAGAKRLTIVNRTPSRALAMAERLGGATVAATAPWDDLDALLTKVDIVLCSTGATKPVIRRERAQKAMKARRGRWLFFIDIAVPRDVEPDVGSVENVYLYDVDALEQVVEQNLRGRESEAIAAERLVDEELKRFAEAEQALGVVPTIKLLRARFLELAKAEAEKTLGKLQSLSEKERQMVGHMADAIVNKLLHAPLTALKKDPNGDELAATVRALFDLHTGHTEEISLDLGDDDASGQQGHKAGHG